MSYKFMRMQMVNIRIKYVQRIRNLRPWRSIIPDYNPSCIFPVHSCLCYAMSLQSCLTPCDPIDGNPPGSPVPGILQARTLEWVAISFSNAWKWKVKSESEVAQSSLTLSDPMDCSLPWDFPGKSTGVGCHCLLV